MLDWILLGAGALLAGFVDAVAGGGGLIQLPTLLAVFPTSPVATLFGTNKAASIWGTAFAATHYARRVQLRWRTLAPALLAAAAAAWCGARLVSTLAGDWLRPVILVLLIGVAWYTVAQRNLGLVHSPRHAARFEAGFGTVIAAALGFYDGFFGPGTGAFLVFLLVRVLGYDFLNASAAAKIINIATNLAALAYFVPHGQWLWQIALYMAFCNVLGAGFGSLSALRRGSRFVRQIFLCVLAVLIVKLARDVFINYVAG